MSRYAVNAAIAALVLLGGAALAASDDGAAATIIATLSARYPDVKIDAVHPVPQLPGMYEIVTQNGIAYTDAAAHYLFAGKILDTRTQQNLTDERWSELHRVDFAALPFELAIKSVRGDGSRRLALFEDPDCPFCRRLEAQIADVTNVTIYTFLYPLESLHPGARARAVKIWCAKDRAAAWSDWMQKSVAPTAGDCAGEPTGRLLALGEKLDISATPTLILNNGVRIEGAISASDLEARLTPVVH